VSKVTRQELETEVKRLSHALIEAVDAERRTRRDEATALGEWRHALAIIRRLLPEVPEPVTRANAVADVDARWPGALDGLPESVRRRS